MVTEKSGANEAAKVLLERVGRSFYGVPAILPMDLSIEPGEFVAILGPSGCGKSTFLRLIADLDRPDVGQIKISSDGAGLRKAFVFQDASLVPWRTLLGNVMLPLELRGEAKSIVRNRAKEALNQVGLGDAFDRYPNELSGGMKMRASVARALVAKPSLLLLDEPFAALDENTRYRLQEELRKLWQDTRMTTIFVTHSVTEAVFLANRTISLSPRPAQILCDRKIDLPLERNSSLRTGPAFIRYVREISQAAIATSAEVQR